VLGSRFINNPIVTNYFINSKVIADQVPNIHDLIADQVITDCVITDQAISCQIITEQPIKHWPTPIKHWPIVSSLIGSSLIRSRHHATGRGRHLIKPTPIRPPSFDQITADQLITNRIFARDVSTAALNRGKSGQLRDRVSEQIDIRNQHAGGAAAVTPLEGDLRLSERRAR
jgi:hypothetical protein